jgi:hypothetical protein
MQVLYFVALANRAPLDVLTDERRVVRREEVGAQPLQCLLDPLMAHAMGMF